jgi:hypothetical protein
MMRGRASSLPDSEPGGGVEVYINAGCQRPATSCESERERERASEHCRLIERGSKQAVSGNKLTGACWSAVLALVLGGGLVRADEAQKMRCALVDVSPLVKPRNGKR